MSTLTSVQTTNLSNQNNPAPLVTALPSSDTESAANNVALSILAKPSHPPAPIQPPLKATATIPSQPLQSYKGTLTLSNGIEINIEAQYPSFWTPIEAKRYWTNTLERIAIQSPLRAGKEITISNTTDAITYQEGQKEEKITSPEIKARNAAFIDLADKEDWKSKETAFEKETQWIKNKSTQINPPSAQNTPPPPGSPSLNGRPVNVTPPNNSTSTTQKSKSYWERFTSWVKGKKSDKTTTSAQTKLTPTPPIPPTSKTDNINPPSPTKSDSPSPSSRSISNPSPRLSPTPEPLSAIVPRGLKNVKNNCAFNSILQFLNSDPHMAVSLRNATSPFAQFFNAYDQLSVKDGPDSQQIREILRKRNPNMSVDKQEDAHEIFTKMLEMIPNAPEVKYKEENCFYCRVMDQYDSPKKEERASCIIVTINDNQENVKLHDLIQYFFEEDTLETITRDGQEWDRTACIRTILGSPEVLYFNVARFVSIQEIDEITKQSKRVIKKVNTLIDVDRELEIKNDKGEILRYRLNSFVTHHGTTIDKGHYTASRIIDDKTYTMNDNVVTKNPSHFDENLKNSSLLCYTLVTHSL